LRDVGGFGEEILESDDGIEGSPDLIGRFFLELLEIGRESFACSTDCHFHSFEMIL
jgi:hypothetical protein